MTKRKRGRLREAMLALVVLLGPAQGVFAAPPSGGGGEGAAGHGAEGGDDPNRISDEVIEMVEETVPRRPVSLFELGDPFLHPGVIGKGITIPTGAVWQPSLLVYGTGRSGFNWGRQSNRGSPPQGVKLGEWANRLDIFGNFRFTPTERFLIGFRPLDKAWNTRGGEFTGYRFTPNEDETNGFNGQIRTAFFEGDFGELFPKLDPNDDRRLDWGFSIGRQPLLLQDGLLVNVNFDAFILTRNSLQFRGIPNLRVSALAAWNRVFRGNNVRDESATMVGILTETDLAARTIEAELLFTGSGSSTGDSLHLGLASIQRIGRFSTTARFLVSYPFTGSNSDVGVDADAVTAGALLFVEVSWVPHDSHDNIYATFFWAIERYSSAARDPDTGGPLGRVGVLFAANGLGAFGSALDNSAQEAVGFAVGRQWFMSGGRRQFTLELGGRTDTNDVNASAIALAVRFQQAIGNRYVLSADAFGGYEEQVDAIYGARIEFIVQF